MNERFFRAINLKILLTGLIFTLAIATLTACGENTRTAVPVQPTTAAPVASPTPNPGPTTVPTLAATPTPDRPVVLIPPATVTPLGNQTNTTPVATIPPVPTGPIVTAPAPTPISNDNASPPASTLPDDNAKPATPQPNGTAQPVSNLFFYLKDGNLTVNIADEKTPRQLAAKVFSFLPTGPGRAVFLQQNGDGDTRTLQLKMIVVTGGAAQESILDTRLFETPPASQQNDGSTRLYGVDTRVIGDMAVSPDGTQLVYTKANLTGPTFDGMSTGEKPTELWLANLDPKNPAPRQLVPNDRDYIARPLWSPDGNRVAFVRTTGFGTGAGYLMALWSVYKDGSRLAFLTGPDLGTVDGAKFQATPAFNLRWVGPQTLAFQATNQIKAPIFLHDLSLGRDFPVALATNSGFETVYCDGIQRYIYLTADANGQPQPGTYSVGLTNPANQTLMINKTAIRLFDCKGDRLLFMNAKKQVTLARLNPDGTFAGGKTLNLNKGDADAQLTAEIAPGGKQAVVQAGKVTWVLAESGQLTELKSGSLVYENLDLQWISDRTLVGLASTPGQPDQLLMANLAGEQVFNVVDTGSAIRLAPPDGVAKVGF